MAHANFSAFSPDSSFLAICSDDGKLKIYETHTNRLKLEYVPNLHLSSPCSAITWIKASSQTNNPVSHVCFTQFFFVSFIYFLLFSFLTMTTLNYFWGYVDRHVINKNNQKIIIINKKQSWKIITTLIIVLLNFSFWSVCLHYFFW